MRGFCSGNDRAFPWSLSVRPVRLTATVEDIGESLLRHGIRKLLIVTAHDGSPAPVEVACRSLHARHGLSVALFSGWQGKSRELLAGRGRPIDLDHAGGSEMSMVLHAAPHLAHPERAVDRREEPPAAPVRLFGGYEALAPWGYTGAPAAGSAAEGAAIVDALAAYVVPYLRKLDVPGWQPGSWMED